MTNSICIFCDKDLNENPNLLVCKDCCEKKNIDYYSEE